MRNLYRLLGVAVLLFAWAFSCGCKSSALGGKLVSSTPAFMDGIELRLTIIANTGERGVYLIEPDTDGSFEAHVKEHGRCVVLVELAKYKASQPTPPHISNNRQIVDIPDDGSIALGDVYLVDAMRFLKASPEIAEKNVGEFLFGWNPISSADAYGLTIRRLGADGKKEVVIDTHNIKQTEITLSEIRRLKMVSGKISLVSVLDYPPFNRKYEDLSAGDYEASVSAWRFLGTPNQIVNIGCTAQGCELRFTVR